MYQFQFQFVINEQILLCLPFAQTSQFFVKNETKTKNETKNELWKKSIACGKTSQCIYLVHNMEWR